MLKRRRLLSGIVWTCVLGAAATTAAGDTFLISYWWGPPATDEAMARIAAANFTVAVCEGGRTSLDLAHKHGLKGMIADSRITARPAGGPEFEGGLDAVVADYSDHPALWGYFITDEPNAAQFENLGAINRRLIERDPDRVPFINLFPTYASPQQLGTDTYEQHVEAFMQKVQPKVLSYDHYAVMQNGQRADYFENLEIIRRAGLKYDTPFVYVLLSVPHFSYRDPSEEDLRWQVYTALAYGARGIVYFTYVSPPETKDYEGWGEAIVTTDGQPTRKYAQVRQINAEVKTLGATLLTLKSTGVYHTAPVPQGALALPAADLIANVTGGELVIGHFCNDAGQRYAMLVNRSPLASAEVSITFSHGVKLAELSGVSGDLQPIATVDSGSATAWNTRFTPGQGRLIKID